MLRDVQEEVAGPFAAHFFEQTRHVEHSPDNQAWQFTACLEHAKFRETLVRLNERTCDSPSIRLLFYSQLRVVAPADFAQLLATGKRENDFGPLAGRGCSTAGVSGSTGAQQTAAKQHFANADVVLLRNV